MDLNRFFRPFKAAPLVGLHVYGMCPQHSDTHLRRQRLVSSTSQRTTGRGEDIVAADLASPPFFLEKILLLFDGTRCIPRPRSKASAAATLEKDREVLADGQMSSLKLPVSVVVAW